MAAGSPTLLSGRAGWRKRDDRQSEGSQRFAFVGEVWEP
jgi:hypothetical protein